jgi:hypothetical protein
MLPPHRLPLALTMSRERDEPLSTNKTVFHAMRYLLVFIFSYISCVTLHFRSAAFHDFNDHLLLGSTDLDDHLFTFLLTTYDPSCSLSIHKILLVASALCCES